MRKFITSAAAIMMTASIATSFVASAGFNPNKDPNGDGRITIADSTYIQMALAGKFKPVDLDQLDADDNGVVSYVDAVYYQLHDAGILNMPSSPNMSSNQNMSLSPTATTSTDTRTYCVYNASTGANKNRDYTLSVSDHNNTSQSNTASPDGIVGNTDDRVPDWSNRGTAKILTNTGFGSGFVVDNHTIATAAHVVYDTEIHASTRIDDVLLFDSEGNKVSVTPVEYHVPKLYQNHTEYSTEYDYALITVKEDLKDYVSYNLGMATDRAVSNQLNVVTVGFPGVIYNGSEEDRVNSDTKHTEMMSTGSIIEFYGTELWVTCDTTPGNSGGPIYTVENINGKTYNTVIGIYIAYLDQTDPFNYEYNIGYKIDEYVLNFLKGNSNKKY